MLGHLLSAYDVIADVVLHIEVGVVPTVSYNYISSLRVGMLSEKPESAEADCSILCNILFTALAHKNLVAAC